MIADQLAAVAPESDLLKLGDDAFAINTALDPAAIRERLRPCLHDDEGLLVIEFETWSSHGTAVDTTWLLRRGH